MSLHNKVRLFEENKLLVRTAAHFNFMSPKLTMAG